MPAVRNGACLCAPAPADGNLTGFGFATGLGVITSMVGKSVVVS